MYSEDKQQRLPDNSKNYNLNCFWEREVEEASHTHERTVGIALYIVQGINSLPCLIGLPLRSCLVSEQASGV